jgi:hypothetical protein
MANGTEKGLHPRGLGIVDKVAWNSFFDDLALIHEDQAITECTRQTHLVRDYHHRHPCTGKIADEFQHACTSSGSRGEVGSSSNRSAGSTVNAQAIAANINASIFDPEKFVFGLILDVRRMPPVLPILQSRHDP